ncbi:MAG: formate dehydrogenase subunit gamma [Frankiales bacterium]|nr:formate dehydrogenase subunit gamma [Frankiales bacterium]
MHGVTALLMLVCILTAAVLYNASLAIAFGNRQVFETVHLYAGIALPVPMTVGLASRAYRADLRRLDRFTRADWLWLRSRSRRDGVIRVGKFNAGQKLNSSLSAGAIIVLLMTGITMYATHLTPLAWRVGATFVHDWAALAVGLLVAGHTIYALRDREAMRGMRTGAVSADWARREHSTWAEEISAASPSSADR